MIDSVGARLRQARELRRLTLEQASETTKVRIHYLQALENDDYSAIPSAAQARGFLRLYAELLGLDVAQLVPPAAPPVSAPVAAAAIVPAPAAPNSLWSSLRQRFGRGAGKDAAAISDDSPAAVPEPAAAIPATAEPNVAPRAAEPSAPVAASTEIKTKETRKPKLESGEDAGGDVKKNERA